jgi:hypothetical protein
MHGLYHFPSPSQYMEPESETSKSSASTNICLQDFTKKYLIWMISFLKSQLQENEISLPCIALCILSLPAERAQWTYHMESHLRQGAHSVPGTAN